MSLAYSYKIPVIDFQQIHSTFHFSVTLKHMQVSAVGREDER